MLFLIFLLPLFSESSSATNTTTALQQTPLFYEGLFFGLQATPDAPSNCVKSFSSVQASYDSFISILTSLQITKVYPLISSFNEYVNQFVSSFDICNYSGFLNKYFTDAESTILNLLINITGNWEKLNEAITNLVLIILYGGDPYALGVYFGEVFRYMTGFSL